MALWFNTDCRRWVNLTVEQSVSLLNPWQGKNHIMACLDWLASGSCLLIGSFNSAPLSRVTQYRVSKCSTDWAPQTTEGTGEKLDKILKWMGPGWGYCCEHLYNIRAAATVEDIEVMSCGFIGGLDFILCSYTVVDWIQDLASYINKKQNFHQNLIICKEESQFDFYIGRFTTGLSFSDNLWEIFWRWNRETVLLVTCGGHYWLPEETCRQDEFTNWIKLRGNSSDSNTWPQSFNIPCYSPAYLLRWSTAILHA